MERQIISLCKRTHFTSRPSANVLNRAVHAVEDEHNYLYHSIIKNSHGYTLVSGANEGVPLLEGVSVAFSVESDLAILYQISSFPNNYLLITRRGNDVVEMRFDVLGVFHKQLIKDVEEAKGRIFIVDSCFELTSLGIDAESVSSEKLTENSPIFLKSGAVKLPFTFIQIGAALLLVLIVFAIAGKIFFAQQKETETKAVNDSHSEYTNALTVRGSVKGFAVQIYKEIAFAESIRGWRPSQISVEGDQAITEFDRIDSSGRLEELISETNKRSQSYLVQSNSNKGIVGTSFIPVPTLSEPVVIPLIEFQRYISLASDDWASIPETAISFGKLEHRSGYDVMTIEISVTDYFGDDFDTLGTIFNGVPVVFERASLMFSEKGSVNGKITLMAYGCGVFKKDAAGNDICSN